jgi:tungstate transport system substrate-binding protein
MIPRRSHSIRRPAWTISRRVALAGVATLAAVMLTPAASHADTSSTITVVGTSDVFDSDLIQNVIKPEFEAANPQYSLNYVSLGTGAAIAYAQAGTASALLVHAASLENQFVAPTTPGQSSYSLEQAGRAIFYGDYVLLGPPADPAHIMTDAPHDMVTAFQDIAAAGEAGTANFVSRANTSGTSVEEHAIWALTTGVPTCEVSQVNGLGNAPVIAGDPSVGAACASPTPAYPSWYHATGLTQGPNVVNDDACNYTNGNCYTLTDRATYEYLVSQGAVSTARIVSQINSASAVGGENLLVNSFHAYAINPAAFPSGTVHINTTGALAFLNWLTSPVAQNAINNYQGGTFHADAAPALTGILPSKVTAGSPLTVAGLLQNKVPGTPPLAGVAMTLSAKEPGSSTAVPVATGTTDSNGTYTLSYTPTSDATYTVSSAAITQLEIPSPQLTPSYSDLLQPTSTPLGSSSVAGTATLRKATAKKGLVTLKGRLSPAVAGSAARLRVYGNHASRAATKGLKFIKAFKVSAGATAYSIQLTLTRGHTWDVSVHYVNAGQIKTGVSPQLSVHVT